MCSVQSNINLISLWITSRHLTINSKKNKYMIVSCKSPSFLTSLPPLFLDGSQLEQVKSFKYLGFIITTNLSWSPHIQSVHSKTHQTIRIFYCNFYKHASPHTLLTLYHSLVIPYFSYCSSVWDPPVSSTNAEILEKTQHFALKMCSHKWDNDYSSLLSTFNLPTLSTRHSISKLCLLYKITNNLLYFPSDIFIHKPLSSYASHHFDPLTFTIPFSHLSASQNYLSLLFSLFGTHFLIM